MDIGRKLKRSYIGTIEIKDLNATLAAIIYIVPGREGVEVFNNKALYASFSHEVFQDPALFSILRYAGLFPILLIVLTLIARPDLHHRCPPSG